MATYTYTLSELSALGVTDITISYRSLEADTVSLRCPMPTATSTPLPWTDGDRIIITDDRVAENPRLFNGRVKGLTTALTGTSYAMQAELSNAIDVLNATIYAAGADYGQSFYSERATGESTEGERLTSSRTVCERCFDWGKADALDCSRDVRFDSTIMGVAGTGSQSCWSLILAALRWVPDACTAMRYSPAGDVLQFLTSRDMDSSTIDMSTQQVTSADGTSLVTFSGVDSCDLRPRHDLVPPVCALTGRKSLILPEGGSLQEPGAFIYHVRSTESTSASARHSAATQAKQQIAANQPWQIVRGCQAFFAPSGANDVTKALTENAGNKEATLKWWQRFAAFALLRKIGAGSLHFGYPVFEAVSAEEAYPETPSDNMDGSASDDEDGVPANYADPGNWSQIYLFWDGRFPACADNNKNLSGLKWCRGRLSQYVWVTSLPSGVTKEELFEFFDGAKPLKENGVTKRSPARYTKLTVEGIWLNKSKKKYQENTNKEAEENEDDSGDNEDAPPVTSSASDPDYSAALRAYYEATRKLYYDGSITLTGVQGNPGALLATGINLHGLMPEWASMDTPCDAIDYDPIARRATLTLGSRDALTMDELLERQELGRQQSESRANGATYNPQDSTPDDNYAYSNNDTDEKDEDEVEYISPNISAGHSADKGRGINVAPFGIYAEGNSWMLNGGMVAGIEVSPTDITALYKKGRKFYYKLSKDNTKVLLRYKD